ncbi:DUF559 domain-containing protein, partial [Legionella yabuuchiae]|uniref:DUF559 domain-containing protein n=1 Tax=Legionella yabuuchiae TaxID=376727 RepID=UPI001A94DFC6
LKSIGLLRMDNQLDVEVLSSLIKSCKPQSMLPPRIIQSLVPHGKEYALEAFVDGFFVDILIPETKEIIEVDGKQHENHWQSCLDQFRDKVLTNRGYKIRRVSSNYCATNISEENAQKEAMGVSRNPRFFDSHRSSESGRVQLSESPRHSTTGYRR